MKSDLVEYWQVMKRVNVKDSDLLYFAPPRWSVNVIDYLRAGKLLRLFYMLNGYGLFIIFGGFTLVLPVGVIGNVMNGKADTALLLLIIGVPILIFTLWQSALLTTGIWWMHRHWSVARRRS